tara:strand:+ start:7413 stop:8270 length:858 start_codon:yes stop_codon:yes gene_type:complete
MAIQTVSQVYNPVTGVFGTGNVQFFSASGAWIVPQGIGKVRVRMWGAGGASNQDSSYYGGGGGGGFAMKTIYDLTGVTSIPVSVGAGALTGIYSSTVTFQAGASSFGSYCSATGGSYGGAGTNANIGGTGVGGDLNRTGGKGWYNGGSGTSAGGGGVASYFGNGADGTNSATPSPSRGGGGGGNGFNTTSSAAYSGGSGFMTAGGFNITGGTAFTAVMPQAMPVQTGFSIDFIGCGGGGAPTQAGINGGGGGFNCSGGFPGGGSAYSSSTAPYLTSAGGLVIVEW